VFAAHPADFCHGLFGQNAEERFLADLDVADCTHLLFALLCDNALSVGPSSLSLSLSLWLSLHLLLVEQFALACHISAIALGCDVLAEWCNALSTQDLVANCSLDDDLEQLTIQHIT
jgi:hypothetical protein